MNPKTKSAEALYPMLEHFHLIGDQPLRAVWQSVRDGSVDIISLEFETCILSVTANEDDDSIDLDIIAPNSDHKTPGVDHSQQEPWRQFIGAPFGWGWIAMNQQGYCDGVLLSFGGIVPEILLNVVASSIWIMTASKQA